MAFASQGTERGAQRSALRPSDDGRNSYAGYGDSVVHLEPLSHFVNIAAITHDGELAFSVWSVDRTGEDLELLVTTRGQYSGVVPLDFSAEPAALRISADGDWRVEIAPLRSAERWNGRDRLERGGDSVLSLADPGAESVRARISVDEGSCIAVRSWGERRELLVNQAAPSVAPFEIPADAVVLTVRTDGRWNLEA